MSSPRFLSSSAARRAGFVALALALPTCLVTIKDPPGDSGGATGAGGPGTSSSTASGGGAGTGASGATSSGAAGGGGSSGGSGSYASEVLVDHPVGYWRLDERVFPDVHDSSGNGHDGTFVGMVAPGASGALTGDSNEAAHFEGGWADFGDVLDFADKAQFTLEAWIYPDPGKEGGIAGKSVYNANDAGDGYDGYIWAMRTGKLRLHRMDENGNSDTIDSTADIPTTGFTHVVTVFDGVNVHHYLDGVADVTKLSGVSMPDLPDPFLIGNSGGWGVFRGTIDEVAVYDYPLAPARIQAHYAAGKGSP